MKTQGNDAPIRHVRIVKKNCPFCGYDKAFEKRSFNSLYLFKCSRCKRFLK